LERVWRLAIQHPKAVHLDEHKTFSITDPTMGKMAWVLQGFMSAVRRQYCDREIFDVVFTEGMLRDTLLRFLAVSDMNTEDVLGQTRGDVEPRYSEKWALGMGLIGISNTHTGRRFYGPGD
jgi:hypothetical protein